MSKYIIDTDQFEKLFETKAVAVLGIGDNLAVPEEGEKTVWTRMLNVADLEELNSDYINEHFGELQDTAYQRGLDDAWECAKKLFSTMSNTEIGKVFPTEWENGFRGLMQMKPQYAIAKLKAYEEKQKAEDEIEVGDEVIYNSTTKCIVVRPEDDERYASLIDSDGTHYSADHRECKKTGRHFDIKGILEAMKHD